MLPSAFTSPLASINIFSGTQTCFQLFSETVSVNTPLICSHIFSHMWMTRCKSCPCDSLVYTRWAEPGRLRDLNLYLWHKAKETRSNAEKRRLLSQSEKCLNAPWPFYVVFKYLLSAFQKRFHFSFSHSPTSCVCVGLFLLSIWAGGKVCRCVLDWNKYSFETKQRFTKAFQTRGVSCLHKIRFILVIADKDGVLGHVVNLI